MSDLSTCLLQTPQGSVFSASRARGQPTPSCWRIKVSADPRLALGGSPPPRPYAKDKNN